MIVVKLSGGLGNQMLQFSLAVALEKIGKTIEFDISSYQYVDEHYGPQIFSIFKIGMSDELQKSFNSLEKREKKVSTIMSIMSSNWFSRFLTPWKLRHLFQFDHKKYNLPIIDIRGVDLSIKNLTRLDNCILDGCPNCVHFDEIDVSLRRIFTFSSVPKNLKGIISSMESEESVSIHVRRGDYLSAQNKKAFAIITDEYYYSACSYINERIPNAHYYVFSDDKEYAQNILKGRCNFTIISENIGRDSYLDMFLMSRCKHNIIANSTFSWWGAWLNNNNDKIVVMPDRWYDHVPMIKFPFHSLVLHV